MLKKIFSLFHLIKSNSLTDTYKYISKKYFFNLEKKIYKHIKKLNDFDESLYECHFNSSRYVYSSQVEGDFIEFGTGKSSVALSTSLKFLNESFTNFEKI